jgi:hypothetical protein
MIRPSGPPQTRQLTIEFLFLDLDTCTRCRATDATLAEAVELTRPVLESIGVLATVTRHWSATSRRRVRSDSSARRPSASTVPIPWG